MLIGNKCDLESKRQVTAEDAKTLAKDYGMEYLETSASEEVNIDNAFRIMARQILDKATKSPKPGLNGEGSLQKLGGSKEKEKKCC